MNRLVQEFNFLVRDHGMILWLLVAAVSASVAVILGLAEISQQRQTIANLIEIDREEREVALAGQSDWGGAAYYSFHLTYDEPSKFAFAALGQRDVSPWKHRIRMLALEGQIYESDPSHPDFALIGRFDFAFVIGFLAPLFIILLLHDWRSREREEGRLEWLSASSSNLASPWIMRSGIKFGLLAICLLLPLWLGGLASQSQLSTLALASVITLAHLFFWGLICLLIGRFSFSSSVNLIIGILVWILWAVITPVAMRIGIDNRVPLPTGGEILLTQREIVNDAWDLPKEATMKVFLERHPEWSDFARIDRPFEWKWYYAFQQVGDQEVETLSNAYREGRTLRDYIAGKLSWLSPPALTERWFQKLARTDAKASLEYEQSIRNFHAYLRTWFYPKMFRDIPFDSTLLADLTTYSDVKTTEK